MDDLQLAVSVARMYYEQGLKQEEISKRVKVSRASVSLILTEARRKGIVQITIRNPLENHPELSRTLAERFNLARCVVVPTAIRETEVLIDLTASRAVDVFAEEARSGDTVGIAWGRTCHAFMSSYNGRGYLHGMQVIPLVGGSNRNMARYQMNEMVRLFAEKLKGQPAFIHAPALPSSREDHERYMGSSEMRSVMEMWRTLDMAVISVGAPPVSREFDGSRIRTRRTATSPESLPIGDICARYFDVRGRFIEDELTKRLIGIPVDSLRRARRILCVAGGVEKAYSLLGALKTRLVTILVTDEQTAAAVLGAAREEEEGIIGKSIRTIYGRRGKV
jgi:deoxyribonucleoside regulator